MFGMGTGGTLRPLPPQVVNKIVAEDPFWFCPFGRCFQRNLPHTFRYGTFFQASCIAAFRPLSSFLRFRSLLFSDFLLFSFCPFGSPHFCFLPFFELHPFLSSALSGSLRFRFLPDFSGLLHCCFLPSDASSCLPSFRPACFPFLLLSKPSGSPFLLFRAFPVFPCILTTAYEF